MQLIYHSLMKIGITQLYIRVEGRLINVNLVNKLIINSIIKIDSSCFYVKFITAVPAYCPECDGNLPLL